jgi:hypothetical protein
MELKDTIELMTSSDYKDRFIAEYQQLKIRVDKLSIMLDKYSEGSLNFTPKCSYDLLLDQYLAMLNYQECLEQRAKEEEIAI